MVLNSILVRTCEPSPGQVDYLPIRAAVVAEVGDGIQTNKRKHIRPEGHLVESACFEKFSLIKTITYDWQLANYSSSPSALAALRSALRCFSWVKVKIGPETA